MLREQLYKGTLLLFMLVGLGATMVPQSAEAVPSFARQTGMACQSCHSNNFPALNAFGRSFRAQGYTMRGSAKLVEGDDLSIPADLKMSLITKLRYQLPGDVDGQRGEIQWPDEAALLVGGRAADNMGFLLEGGLAGQEVEAHPVDANEDGVIDANDGGAVAGESTGNFLSYKTHLNLTDNVGLVLFGTDGLGVGYGMELMNTGLQRSQRPIENRTGYSAGQRLGTAAGTATGLAAVYHTGDLMVQYSHWAPTWGNVNANILGGLAHYVRVNYFMNSGGWDLGFGANTMSGTVKTGATDPANETSVGGAGVDVQALGQLGNMPAEFYFSYGTAPSDDNGAFNNTGDDQTAMGLLGKFFVAPKTSVYAAYGTTDNGTDTINDTTVGLQYMLAQNSKFEVYNVSNSSDDDSADYTMLMLFSGF